MCKQNLTKSLIRAFGVMAAVAVIVSGVTFAALQSQQAKLTGNIIQTATANLQVSPNGSSYANSLDGFAFQNLVPGGVAVPNVDTYAFYLKNAGGTPLSLKLAVSSTPLNPDNADLSKVHIMLWPGDGSSVQSFTLAALISSYSTGGLPVLSASRLTPGTAMKYNIQIAMDVDAVTGSGANISNIDLSFSGTATN